MHHRFFVGFKICDDKRVEMMDGDILHQLVSVFRAKAGDKIILLDDSGYEFHGNIKSINKKEALIDIENKIKGIETSVQVAVFQSVIKKDNMETVFEKCTEIGASRLVPVVAERSVRLNLNFDRLYKIVKEASEQCGRAELPEISEIIDFEGAIEKVKSDKDIANFIFHEERHALIDGARHDSAESECCDRLTCEFMNNFKDIKKFNLFVGPEGGFSDKEIELAKKSGFYVLSLGDLVLRSETAGMMAGYACINFQ